MRALVIGTVLVCIAAPGLAAAIDQVDEVITSGEIKEECHFTMSDPNAEERARLNAKLDAMGKAAWHEMWEELDRQDPSQHEENGKKADKMLRQRMEAGMQKAHSLVAEKGCAVLTPHAREVLDSYFH